MSFTLSCCESPESRSAWAGRAASAPVGGDHASPVHLASQAATCLLVWPFDAMRLQYGAAVRAGVIRRSLLGSSHFERRLGLLERTLLGPLARRV
jgi:hypothetical protein